MFPQKANADLPTLKNF